MAGFDFEIALQVSCFLFAIWAVGFMFGQLKLPPILGQLLIGIILGPNALDMVPYASNGLCGDSESSKNDACGGSSRRLLDNFVADHGELSPIGRLLADDGNLAPIGRLLAASSSGSGSGSGEAFWDCTWVQWDRWEDHYHLTNVWTFAGSVGVTLMIFESGMHIHFDKVAAIGKKALIVAIMGTGLPIVFGIIVVGALFSECRSDLAFYPWGFAAGCAFAPTSVGISINLLVESNMLNSMSGQTIIVAAFIDDVFSIVTLIIMQTLAEGGITAAKVLVPLVCCFTFLALGVLYAPTPVEPARESDAPQRAPAIPQPAPPRDAPARASYPGSCHPSSLARSPTRSPAHSPWPCARCASHALPR